MQLRYLFITALFVLASCARPKPIIYKDVERVSFQKADFSSVTIRVDLKLYNPNKYALVLKDPSLGIFIDGRYVGTATIDDRIVMPARDTFLLPALLRIDLLNAIPNAIEVIRKKEITLKVDGSLKGGIQYRASGGGIFFPIPVHYEGKQRIDIKL